MYLGLIGVSLGVGIVRGRGSFFVVYVRKKQYICGVIHSYIKSFDFGAVREDSSDFLCIFADD